MKKAIVVIDMQKDFIDGSLGTKEAVQMLPRLVEKLAQESKNPEVDLFFTQDTHEENYLQTQEGKHLPVEHCIRGTKGWEFPAELSPYVQKAKAIVEKNTFGSTKLPTLLIEYKAIELCGLCTDICVVSNALLLKASYPEKNIHVDAQCCAGTTPNMHVKALDVMRVCQVEIH